MSLVLLLYALFASVFTVAKMALAVSSPFFLIGFRMLIAGAILLIFCFIRKSYCKISFQGKICLLLLGIGNIYITNALEVWGLQYLTTFKTCFIYSLSPYLSALLSYLLFKEVLSLKKWFGLVVGFVGFLPILVSQTVLEEQTGSLWVFSWAELAVVGAVFASVSGWMLLQHLVTKDGCSSVQANGVSMLIGGFFALIHSSAFEVWKPIPVNDMQAFLGWTVVLIVVSNFVCYNLYGHLLKRFSATFMSFAGLTTPYFTALFGSLFLGEQLTMSFFVSSLVVSFGLVLFYQEELQENYKKMKNQWKLGIYSVPPKERLG
jgi:drug/metabolite transporter (DMT)-like permease